MAVRLVQAEHEAARDPVTVVDGHQIVVAAAEPVDVLAEMDVRVEDLGTFRKRREQHPRVVVDQCLRASERFVHRP